jgi:RNA polymerase subunit RPABC4/transcription elongation factor Spt4
MDQSSRHNTSSESVLPTQAPAQPVPAPVPSPQAEICPYCGAASTTLQRCSACGGRFDPLSKQVSQNQMGPWQIRAEVQPHRPGCSYATLRRMIERGVIRADSVIRGPSTSQFWMRADRVPGVAHLMGACHACGESTNTDAFACNACGSTFHIDQDRQHLGLMATRLLPGDASPRVVAAHASPASAAVGNHAGTQGEHTAKHEDDSAVTMPFDQTPQQSIPLVPNEPQVRDRRVRSLRRQNVVLLIACICLSGVLVLLVGVMWAWRPQPEDRLSTNPAPDSDRSVLHTTGNNESESPPRPAATAFDDPLQGPAVSGPGDGSETQTDSDLFEPQAPDDDPAPKVSEAQLARAIAALAGSGATPDPRALQDLLRSARLDGMAADENLSIHQEIQIIISRLRQQRSMQTLP